MNCRIAFFSNSSSAAILNNFEVLRFPCYKTKAILGLTIGKPLHVTLIQDSGSQKDFEIKINDSNFLILIKYILRNLISNIISSKV